MPSGFRRGLNLADFFGVLMDETEVGFLSVSGDEGFHILRSCPKVGLPDGDGFRRNALVSFCSLLRTDHFSGSRAWSC